MKSIIYFLLAIFLLNIFLVSFPGPVSGQTQTVKIHCIDEDCNLELLNKSGRIIKNRLGDFNINNIEISVLERQKNIVIEFKEEIDLNEIKSLLTSIGKFEFYETYNRTKIIESLSEDDTLFTLLNIAVKKKELKELSSDAILGFLYEDNKEIVDSYLHLKKLEDKEFKVINFAWSWFYDGDYELFLLKQKSCINKSHINECVGKYYPDSDKADIIISFTSEGSKIWQEITGQNIGKTIAITMDNEVYSAPKVISEIQNGKCRITGNLSTNEVNRFISLINNDELPLHFEVIQ